MTWADFAGGVVAGLVATALWVAADRLRTRHRLRKKFGRYAGIYSVTRKQETEPKPETVVIEVRGNVLDVRLENLPGDDSASGRILMDEQLRGEGHYWRMKNGVQLWGFWDVQVRNEQTLLVHETYSKAETKTRILSGYRWAKL